MSDAVHALERRWPRRGERAPFCGADGCPLRSRFVYHVGVHAVGNYCEEHGVRRLADAVRRGVPR